MNFWLIKFEEDLPVDEEFYPYRMSMLADQLLVQGHDVVRWASDFNHKLGKPRFGKRHQVEVTSTYKIELLRHMISYGGSHSIGRILALYLQSFSLFVSMMKASEPPDIVVAAMPAPITCFLTALYCKLKNVPFFIDARDMWPDILFDELTGFKKILAMPLSILMRMELKLACRWARGLIGITDPFRDFLLKQAKRAPCPYDASFPIGFSESQFSHVEADEIAFWQARGVEFNVDDTIIYFAGTLNKTVLTEAPKVAKAMRSIATKGFKFKLVMCGRGNSQYQVEALFDGIENVVFPGHVGPVHLAYLKARSSIALLSIEARHDYLSSLSNKFFDYASGGLPIVTNLGGVPRSVLEGNNAGFFYESAEELERILTNLSCDEELLQEYSRNSRMMFERDFDAIKVYTAFAKHLGDSAKS